MKSPSPNGANGNSRDTAGRFAKGNAGGPGNPHARKVGQLRSAMLRAVSATDMRAIVAKLVEQAKGGSVPAAREVIDRTVGKPTEADLIERIERLETLLEGRQ